MNVLLSAYACMPNAGSEPGNGWNWAVHLAARGINVTVLTRDNNRGVIEPYLAAHPVANLQVEYVAVPTKLFKAGSGMHYALWQACVVKPMRALHRIRGFDVIHHLTYTSIHVPTQLWRVGVPTIFGPVGGGQTAPATMLPYFGASRSSEERRTLLTRALRHSPWHRRWLQKMRVVLAANSDTADLIKALGRQDVRVQFDNGIAASYLADAPRSFPPETVPVRLLWVGRLLPRKALPLALDALANTQRPATLTIVGDGMSQATVRDLIGERGLSDRVEWAGRRLSWEEVRAAYGSHDALLFTSIRETSGLQLLEAMAMALPILTLDLHGARDVVPADAGIKVPITHPPEVVRDLAAAIDRFAASPAEEKERMSRASWQFAETCTWATRAEEAEHLYRSLLSSGFVADAAQPTPMRAPLR